MARLVLVVLFFAISGLGQQIHPKPLPAAPLEISALPLGLTVVWDFKSLPQDQMELANSLTDAIYRKYDERPRLKEVRWLTFIHPPASGSPDGGILLRVNAMYTRVTRIITPTSETHTGKPIVLSRDLKRGDKPEDLATDLVREMWLNFPLPPLETRIH